MFATLDICNWLAPKPKSTAEELSNSKYLHGTLSGILKSNSLVRISWERKGEREIVISTAKSTASVEIMKEGGNSTTSTATPSNILLSTRWTLQRGKSSGNLNIKQ